MGSTKPASRATIRPVVLIVEDNVLIAMALEDVLVEAGFRVIGPARSVMIATAMLKVEQPDVAVLDYNLTDETVTPVAKSLAALGIPFVLSSARSEIEIADPVFDRIQNLGKPAPLERLVQALSTLLA